MKRLPRNQFDESDGFDDNCDSIPDPMADFIHKNESNELVDPTADLVRITFDTECNNYAAMPPDPTTGLINLARNNNIHPAAKSGYCQLEAEPIENRLEEIRREALLSLLEQQDEFVKAENVNRIPVVPEKWQCIRIEIENLSSSLRDFFYWDLHAYIPENTCETIISIHQNKIAIIPKIGYFPKTEPEIKALRTRLQNFINLLYQQKYQRKGLTVSIEA